MAPRTDLKETIAPQPSVATSSGLEDPTGSAGSSIQHSDSGEGDFKTIQLLKEWPIITSTVNRATQYYESLKNSSRVLNWSCALAEKSVSAIRERSSTVLPVIYPAVRIADLAASELAEELQKKLPVVRQPPSQVSDAVTSGLRKLLAPLLDKIEFFVNKGKRRTTNAAKSVVERYRKLVHSLDEWLERVESHINASKSKAIQVPVVQEQTPVTEPPQLIARSLVKGALDAATNAGLFSVGASVCLLSRLPVIGSLLDQTPSPSPASSKSTSPGRHAEMPPPQSSSESATPADAAETLEQGVTIPVPKSQASKEALSEK